MQSFVVKIKDLSYDEIVICGVSFGEILEIVILKFIRELGACIVCYAHGYRGDNRVGLRKKIMGGRPVYKNKVINKIQRKSQRRFTRGSTPLPVKVNSVVLDVVCL